MNDSPQWHIGNTGVWFINETGLRRSGCTCGNTGKYTLYFNFSSVT